MVVVSIFGNTGMLQNDKGIATDNPFPCLEIPRADGNRLKEALDSGEIVEVNIQYPGM